MNVVWGLILAFLTFVVLNLFLPAGWAAVAAIVVFLLTIFNDTGLRNI